MMMHGGMALLKESLCGLAGDAASSSLTISLSLTFMVSIESAWLSTLFIVRYAVVMECCLLSSCVLLFSLRSSGVVRHLARALISSFPFSLLTSPVESLPPRSGSSPSQIRRCCRPEMDGEGRPDSSV